MEVVREQRLIIHRLSSRRRDNLFELGFELDTSSEQNTAIVTRLTEKKLTCDVTLTGLEEGE